MAGYFRKVTILLDPIGDTPMFEHFHDYRRKGKNQKHPKTLRICTNNNVGWGAARLEELMKTLHPEPTLGVGRKKPSLQLTARTRKMVIGQRLSFSGSAYFQVLYMLVLGRVSIGDISVSTISNSVGCHFQKGNYGPQTVNLPYSDVMSLYMYLPGSRSTPTFK